MKKISIPVLVLYAVMLTASCSSNNKSDSANEKRLEYTPEINEVDVITLKEEDFPLQLLSNGKLSAAKRSALCFRHGGIVTKIHVTNGSAVFPGQVIAELDSSEQKLALASATLELDRAKLDLQDILVGLGYSLEQQDSVPADVMKTASIRSGYTAAEYNLCQARKALDETTLRAPFSGHVADIKTKQWEPVGSEPFCTMLGDNEFDVTFTILESEYNFISIGQHVSITTFSESDPVSGKIVSVNPTVNKNGQIVVTAHVPALKGMLDGMNVKVIVDKVVGHQLVVPKSAVVIRDGLEVLFRYDGEEHAEWVYVNILQTNSTSYSVQANADRGADLKAGDIIIVSGNLNLADGSHVAIKE